jgi:hypothetical protein
MTPIEAMKMAIETINLGALVKCHEAHYVVTKLTEAIEQMEKANGYVCVMHPDDPMLKMLDGQLVFIQRTMLPSSTSQDAAMEK